MTGIVSRYNDNLNLSASRHFFICFAYVLICIQYFLSWHLEGADVLCRYLSTFSILLSIDYSRIRPYHWWLFAFLCIAIVVRRLLIVWVLYALVYQIVEFKITIKDLARIAICILIIEIFIQIDGVLIGHFENSAIQYAKSKTATFDLGTGNANRFASLIFKVVLISYLLFKDRNKAFLTITIIILSIGSYFLTGSRTSFLCCNLVLVLSIAYWNNWLNIPKLKYFIGLIPMLFFIITFIAAFVLYGDNGLNEIFSGRLWYILKFTQDFTVTNWIIGAPRTIDEPLDSAYFEIIHTGGICLALFFCIAMMKSTIHHYDIIKKYIPFIIPILIGGLTESIIIRPSDISVIFWILVLIPDYSSNYQYYKALAK